MPFDEGPDPARAPSSRLPGLAAAVVAALGACGVAQPAATSPMGGGGTVELEPVPARESPRAWRRLVFTCATPSLVIFSDRPCGPAPALHEVTVRAPGASPTVAAPAPAASTRPAPALPARDAEQRAADEGGRTEACSRLANAVQTLDARMRAGYSAREAGRLWARWREAKQRLREADC